jgi:hypothetical protein
MAREETVEYPELRHVFASSELVDLRVRHHRKFHRVSRADSAFGAPTIRMTMVNSGSLRPLATYNLAHKYTNSQRPLFGRRVRRHSPDEPGALAGLLPGSRPWMGRFRFRRPPTPAAGEAGGRTTLTRDGGRPSSRLRGSASHASSGARSHCPSSVQLRHWRPADQECLTFAGSKWRQN